MIQFLTINYLEKLFIKVHRFRRTHQKPNSKDFFRPMVVLRLFKIQFSSKNFLAKLFVKVDIDFDLFTKTEFERFIPTPGGVI